MGFNEEELLKIEKATSGVFKKKARTFISNALSSLRPYVNEALSKEEPEREEMLKNIANFFPDINLYIFTLEPFLTEQKNIKFETKFIEGQELYTLINQHDTFVLSFSERPNRTY